MSKELRVLIVDDEKQLCDILKENLMDFCDKYVIKTAYSGPAAISRLESEKFDVLVTDNLMPGMSGIELLQKTVLFREDMETIILTGYGELRNAIEALRLSVGNYLQKPISTAELHFAIQRVGEKLFLKRKLRESEHRYRTLFEGTDNGVAIYKAEKDGADFTFLDINRAGEKIEGRRRNDLMGKSVLAIGDSGLLDNFRNVYRNGKSIHHQFSFYKDNRIVERREYFIYKLPFGEIGTIFSDETKRKRAEELVRSERDKFQRIIDSIRQGMLIVDENNRIEFQNWQINERFGSRIGERCYKLIGLDESCSQCNIGEVVKTGAFIRFETIASDGRDYEINVSSFTDIDGEAKVFCLMEDISEKKRLQAETQRAGQLAAIGELAAGIAHEINNPINGIISLGEILRDRCVDKAEDADIPERIIREGDRIAVIVKNLLSFAQDRGDERSLVSISDILDDALGLMERLMNKDGIEIRADIPRDIPAIYVRSQEIQQVFLNLMSNSRYALNQKYKESNPGKRLEIKARLKENKERAVIRFVFSDSGTGIPAGVKDKICLPFFSTKPKGEGTGLGLSISHGIIENHGGTMRFESRAGEFTKVIVDIPADRGK